MVARSRCLGAGWLLLALLSLLAARQAGAHTEEENQKFINTVLGYLNNNLQCVLPTFAEVEMVRNCMDELKEQWGDQFEARLTDDQRLLRKTLLDDWHNFQQRMNSAVIVRSAKKRQFLCKIEDYQEAKFGDSVCTRIKDIKGPITNHIFEKNPIVAYLKHLETGAVVERPVEPTTPAPVSTEPPTTQPPTTEPPTTEPPTTQTPTTGAPTTQTPTTEAPTTEAPTTQAEPETEPAATEVSTEVPVIEDEIVDEVATETPPVEAEKPESGVAEPRDEHEERGVQHTYIGRFTFEFVGPNMPDEFTFTYRRGRRNLDNERDPLDDIPVPSSNDDQPVEEKPTEPPVEPAEEEDEEEVSTTTALPMFDEFGAEYIEEMDDDLQLERLVRAPRKDWQFDPVFGYFKWPDECNADMCPLDQQLNDSYLSLDGVWFQFLADPYAYDEYLESIKPTTTTTARPRINAALLRRQKNHFDQSIKDDSRRGQTFGWNNEHTPKKIQLYMPEINRERWREIADNGFCKINYNTEYLKNKSKSGFRSVKKFFKKDSDSRLGLNANTGLKGAADGEAGEENDSADDVQSVLVRETLLAAPKSSWAMRTSSLSAPLLAH